MSVRLQKFLADAGVASRRAGEKFILDGRVTVNGKIVRLLGSKVDPAHDKVAVDGKLIRSKEKIYLALHKPVGCVCSRNDELQRPTIYELIPREWTTVNTVGRLDFKSEGLIFLTNDGEFALRLTHPRYGIVKKYVAMIEGEVTPEMTRKFVAGIFDGGDKLKALRAHIVSSTRAKSVVELELAEGKNREVRRLFESQRLTVKKLIRTQIGKIRLGELKPGKWRTMSEVEIKSLISDL
ncbi:MAG TPA: pseudouridine synthase [Candidatus Sulfotelmatobacter sp.]|jgi:23S rRNA pseudouridine2605 synthase|nr:pseudouridine synthase [Candidatus Sulfotelmatobacter sp.]